jgi:hypothetical protein
MHDKRRPTSLGCSGYDLALSRSLRGRSRPLNQIPQPRNVVICSSHDHGSSRGACGGRMEICKLHTLLGQAINVWRADFAAKTSWIGKAQVIRENDQEIWSLGLRSRRHGGRVSQDKEKIRWEWLAQSAAALDADNAESFRAFYFCRKCPRLLLGLLPRLQQSIPSYRGDAFITGPRMSPEIRIPQLAAPERRNEDVGDWRQSFMSVSRVPGRWNSSDEPVSHSKLSRGVGNRSDIRTKSERQSDIGAWSAQSSN